MNTNLNKKLICISYLSLQIKNLVITTAKMADVDFSQISMDEKIAQAQELLSIATRNYYVKAYSDAVDDLSTVCQIFSEVYGPMANELGKPYLMYGKCLIAVGQEENKLMEIPEEDEEDEEDEEESESASKTSDGAEKEEKAEQAAEAEASVPVNGTHEQSAEMSCEVDTAQPGTSSGITKSEVDGVAADDDEEDDVANLQLAWEVLEMAVGIFAQQPERAKELAESYIELAGISFENSNFEVAINDFKKALGVLHELPEKDNRELAEINYKVGLAYTMLNMFDDAKISLMKACCYLDEVVKAEEAKEQTEEVAEAIKDLKETKVEIENKIAEVDDYKQQSMDVVKQELAKLIGHQDGFDKAAGEGTSSSAAKPAADISHLIKRKKPEDAGSVASANDINHLVKRKKEE